MASPSPTKAARTANAPAKRAPAKKATAAPKPAPPKRPSRAGIKNKATLRREALEAQIGRKLTTAERAEHRLNPDQVEAVFQGLDPLSVAAKQSELPAPDVSETGFSGDGLTEAVDAEPELPELVLVVTNGLEVHTELPPLDSMRLDFGTLALVTPREGRNIVVNWMNELSRYRKTPLVEQTLKTLYALYGELLGV